MPILLSFCDYPFWILWLVPFILGLLLGWFIWGVYRKYRKLYEATIQKNKQCKSKISSLEKELATSNRKVTSLTGDLAMSKGRLRELEQSMKSAANADANNIANAASEGKQSYTALIEDNQKTAAQLSNSHTQEKKQDLDTERDDATTNKVGFSDHDRTRLDQDDIVIQGNPSTTDNLHSENQSDAILSSHDQAVQGKRDTERSIRQSDEDPHRQGETKHQDDKYSKLDTTNLQIIEGIGPKMESLCKENGIPDWDTLASQSPEDLKAMLGKYGDRYRIIDPEIWPLQAIMARDKNWEGLIKYQKTVGGLRQTDSKLEKVMIKLGLMKQWKDNDLKAIEGIGPKIENLLQEHGILTWKALSEISESKLNTILESGGPRFKLADPSTWASQAKLAAAGKFDELENFQSQI